MKRILYLSYDGLTDQLGQSQIIPYLSGLAIKGFSITIISFEKKDAFERRRYNISVLLKQAGINWVPLRYHKSPQVLSTLYDIRRMKQEALRLHSVAPFDMLHCRSYITALVGLYFKRKMNVHFVFDMRGFWADERIEGNIWSIKNPIHLMAYKYFKKKEKGFLCESDAVVIPTESGKKIILSWNLPEINAQKIIVIPCCADLELFNFENNSSEKTNQLRSSTGIDEDSYSLSYLGSIGTWYALEEMLRFYERLKIKFRSTKFLFLTGENPKYIFDTATKLNISIEGIIIREVERRDVPAYLSLCPFSIFFIKPTFSKIASSPVKLGEILGMGIPIICNTGIGDVDFQILNAKVGMVISDFSDENFDKVINRLPLLRKSNKKNIRKLAEEIYSLEKGIVMYEKIYLKNTYSMKD